MCIIIIYDVILCLHAQRTNTDNEPYGAMEEGDPPTQLNEDSIKDVSEEQTSLEKSVTVTAKSSDTGEESVTQKAL